MTHKGLRRAVRVGQKLTGRDRMAKLIRVANNEVRLDVGNRITTNGEIAIQRAALSADHPVVFDVGAHFGEWSSSLLAQPVHGRPDVHAFEPSASTFAILSSTVGDSVTLHNCALSDAVGLLDLQVVAEGAGANSLVRFTDPERVTGATEQVEVSTVTRVCEELGIPHITLLKIDAEGHDLSVIRGARALIDRRDVGLIQFEYNSRWIDARHFLLDVFEELQPRGYQLGKVTPRGIEFYSTWHPELEKFVEANYLAWLPSWSDRLKLFPWWGP